MALTLLALICAVKAAAGEIEQVAVGYHHTCVRANGYVKCWGRNNVGQLGLGTTDNMGDGSNEMGDHLPLVAFGTGRSAVEVTAGELHTCARLDDGSVKCWGYNWYGQLGLGSHDYMGDGASEMGDYLPPVALGTGRSAVGVAAGYSHTCARLDDGTVKCWGRNNYGQLGLGTTDDRGDGSSEMGDYLPAVALGTGRSAVEVTAGSYHTCARLDDGSVKCWGSNSYGVLGLGTTDNMGDGSNEMGDHLPLVAFGTGRSAVEVAAGKYHTCARLDDGTVKCWGHNNYGQLGLGTTEDRGDGSSEMGDYLPAVALGTGRSAVELAPSLESHTCARLDDGSVKCWGNNGSGQLGLGTTEKMGDASNEMGDYLPAVDLGTGRSAVEVAAAASHTCARLDDGSVKCWGDTYYGQLGLGTTDDRGDGSNEMGDHLPPVDMIMPTTTTTTSKTTTSSTTGTSSTSATGSTTTSSSTDSTTSTSTTSTSTTSTSTTSTSTTSTSTTSTSTSGSTSRTSSTSTTGESSGKGIEELPSMAGSVTTSTAATEEAREEQQRREDAKAAVNKIESATQVAVKNALTSLLGSLNGTGNASTGVLGEASISTDAGDGKVVVYSPERLAESGEPATVSVDNSSATAEVPVGVLQQAQVLAGDGHLMLSVVVMNEELSEKFSTSPPATQEGFQEQQGPVTTLLSAPLVINVRDENGTVIDIGPLKTPMTVQLEVKKRRLDQVSKSARRKCAYWDEERAVWETNPTEIESIEDDEAKPGLVRCRTRRMAIFSVVLEEFENTLKCSTLGQLLTADALASLSRTDWLLQMPTLVVMCFLFMLLGSFFG
ncbi:Herc4 [Symbiodinium necroappetens]|uniref:Herc4 protein n=1 Tax=Symbiodinium necroappetens TaxID=1628268 RepID=A0A812SWJ0_9DINO|nr:Herc4 [Symbiodinium necroappetens]